MALHDDPALLLLALQSHLCTYLNLDASRLRLTYAPNPSMGGDSDFSVLPSGTLLHCKLEHHALLLPHINVRYRHAIQWRWVVWNSNVSAQSEMCRMALESFQNSGAEVRVNQTELRHDALYPRTEIVLSAVVDFI